MAKQIKALELDLTAEEEAAAERIYESLKGKAEQQLKNMARMMAAKQPEELLSPRRVRVAGHVVRFGSERAGDGHQRVCKKGALIRELA